LAALRKVQLVKRWSNSLAKGVNTLGQSGHIDVLLRLHFQLAHLPGETLLRLGEVPPFTLEFLVADDFGEVDIEQAGLLPLELHERLTQGPLPRLQCLREPCAPSRSFQLLANERRLREHVPEILPDDGIEGLSGNKAGGAAFPKGSPRL
jgi:hypothetical protein